MLNNYMTTAGKAYCFFKSAEEISKKGIEPAKERIRQALARMKADPDLNIPQRVRFSLYNLGELVPKLSLFIRDSKKTPLTVIAEEWKEKGADYLLKVVLPTATNRETADLAGDIFNLLYGCTEILYVNSRNIPVADIYFEQENGIYVSKLQIE